jgi:hypothetical protein
VADSSASAKKAKKAKKRTRSEPSPKQSETSQWVWPSVQQLSAQKLAASPEPAKSKKRTKAAGERLTPAEQHVSKLQRELASLKKQHTRELKSTERTVSEQRVELAGVRKGEREMARTLAKARREIKALEKNLRKDVSSDAGVYMLELERRERRLKRNETDWESRREGLLVLLREQRTALHRGDVKQAHAATERAQASAKKYRIEAQVADSKHGAIDEYCELLVAALDGEKIGAHLQCRWDLEEINTWGVGNKPYPSRVVRLAMMMCLNDAPCSQLPKYIQETLGTFFPSLKDLPVPSAETCRRWRLGLLVLSDLVAALKFAIFWVTS